MQAGSRDRLPACVLSWGSDVLTRERIELRAEPASAHGWAETRFWIGCVGVFVTAVVFAFAATTLLLALVLGYRPVVVVSGSMEPSISVGDVVLYERGGDTEVGPGSVVIFADPKVDGGTLIHRVTDVDPVTGDLRTKGDANASADSGVVTANDMIGVGRILVPYVGLPAAWLQTGRPLLAIAFIAIVVLAAWAARWGWYSQFDPWARTTDRKPSP
jgi:signal peptidase I